MHYVWKIILCLFLELGLGQLVTSQESGTTPQSAFSVDLDLKNDTMWPMGMSTIDKEFEDWFFYYDNLTTKGLTNYSKAFFADVNLTNVESEAGVWVAFFTEKGSPVFGEEFPLIEFSATAQRLEILEITYYIHKTARISIEESEDVSHSLGSMNSTLMPMWQTSVFNLTTSTFVMLLMPTEPGDFVLIDRILIRGFETIPRSTYTYPTILPTNSTDKSTSPFTSSSLADTSSFTGYESTTRRDDKSSGISLGNYGPWGLSLVVAVGTILQIF